METTATSSSTTMDSSPPSILIKSLHDFPGDDDGFWNETVEFPALRVPVQDTARIRQQLKSMLWRHARGGAGGRPNIYPDPQQPNEYRILILQQQQQQSSDTTTQKEAEQQRQRRLIQQVLEQNNDIGIQKTTYTMNFTYDDYTVEQAMRKILPVELHNEIPCSFESVGPIAHVNLRTPYLRFQYWIGKILLDKNQPRIQTIVTKTGNIDNEYRTFGMHIIAQKRKSDSKNDSNGNDEWSVVTVKEEKCNFTLDFQKVYWNSRLAGEHRRLVQEIQKYATAKQQQQQQETVKNKVTIVADLMAGVGPFAIPLTATAANVQKQKKKHSKMKDESHHHLLSNNIINNNSMIRVYANDLNPDSFKYLKINAQQNKCRVSQDLICSNQDARAVLAQLQKDKVVIDHVIMNLPASAPEFLDMFRGYNNSPAAAVLSTEGDDALSTLSTPLQASSEPHAQTKTAAEQSSKASCSLPRIHVYCFAPKPTASQAQEDQTKKACTHDDVKSNTSGRNPPSAFNSSVTANGDNHQCDYQESLDRCAKALGIEALDRKRDCVHIHVVRDVSPQKNMICISFQLPFQVTILPPSIVVPTAFLQPAAVVDTKTTTKHDYVYCTGVNGIQTSRVVDAADDDKRKRSFDPIVGKTPAYAEESMAETDPKKRSKGPP
jgi:tRNA (guanine37-N1)-methyltransferase